MPFENLTGIDAVPVSDLRNAGTFFERLRHDGLLRRLHPFKTSPTSAINPWRGASNIFFTVHGPGNVFRDAKHERCQALSALAM